MAVKKPTYSPLGDDDLLSAERALLQAASALDLAAMFAVETKNVEGLATVASLYIDMAGRLAHDDEQEQDDGVDHDALAKKIPLGFNPPVVVPVEIDEEATVDE